MVEHMSVEQSSWVPSEKENKRQVPNRETLFINISFTVFWLFSMFCRDKSANARTKLKCILTITWHRWAQCKCILNRLITLWVTGRAQATNSTLRDTAWLSSNYELKWYIRQIGVTITNAVRSWKIFAYANTHMDNITSHDHLFLKLSESAYATKCLKELYGKHNAECQSLKVVHHLEAGILHSDFRIDTISCAQLLTCFWYSSSFRRSFHCIF